MIATLDKIKLVLQRMSKADGKIFTNNLTKVRFIILGSSVGRARDCWVISSLKRKLLSEKSR